MADAKTELIEALTDLGRLLLTETALSGDLDRVVAVADATVPGCDGASITLGLEGRPRTEAATDRVVLELDLAQYESGEGPCLSALHEARPVRLDLVTEQDRFPTFAERATEAGVRCTMSLPFLVDDEAVGALNMYSYADDAFDATSQSLAAVLAAQAGAAIAKSRLLAAGRRATEVAQQSADDQAEVGIAEGMLMAIEQCTAKQAGSLLRIAAVSEEQTLTEMARRIIAQVEGQPPYPPRTDG